MLHHKTQKLELTEQKDMDKAEEQSKHIENIFRDYEQKYQEIINLLPRNREAVLKQTDNEKKENLNAAKQIYHDVFGKKEDPYVQYFRLKIDLAGHFREGSSHHDYKKLLKQDSAISLLNYGSALTINTVSSYRYHDRAISCFVMVLLLENNIQSVLSKEALKQLTKLKGGHYSGARATFYLNLFQSPNNMEKNTFYKDYLHSNGSDRYIVDFFDKVSPSKKASKVMPEATRIKLLALLDAKKKEFIDRVDRDKQADKKLDNKQVETKIVETEEVLPKPIISTLPAQSIISVKPIIPVLPGQSIFAPPNLSNRPQAIPNLSEKQQLKKEINDKKREILNAKKELLKMENDVIELELRWLELKNPTQESRPSASPTMQSNKL